MTYAEAGAGAGEPKNDSRSSPSNGLAKSSILFGGGDTFCGSPDGLVVVAAGTQDSSNPTVVDSGGNADRPVLNGVEGLNAPLSPSRANGDAAYAVAASGVLVPTLGDMSLRFSDIAQQAGRRMYEEEERRGRAVGCCVRCTCEKAGEAVRLLMQRCRGASAKAAGTAPKARLWASGQGNTSSIAFFAVERRKLRLA